MARVDLDTKPLFKVGPGGWPNTGESEWEAREVSKIKQIFISFEEDQISTCIHSLQFQYFDHQDGKTKFSPVYGGNSNHAGLNFETVVFERLVENSLPDFDFDVNECITRISGAALHRDDNDNRVTCLTFETNFNNKYGPFGSVPEGAKNFSFGFGRGNQFAGFFGSCSSKHISSIGCFIKPSDPY